MGAAAGFDGGDAGWREGGVGVEEIGVFAMGKGERWVLVRLVGQVFELGRGGEWIP